MTELSLEEGKAIVAAYDFIPFARIIDVGDGHGTLAAMIAQSAPQTHVTMFDLSHVVEGTTKQLVTNVPTPRIATIAGNFFDYVLGPTNLCVLKYIIHNWEDTESIHILTKMPGGTGGRWLGACVRGSLHQNHRIYR